ncbi:phage regulatory CII family protein [Achromobacter denitrificans]|uniref:phage regulatory CII family protein n=1 Tax=Achromobacter denitrificans TaxID=32002 RepID=UPI003B974780
MNTGGSEYLEPLVGISAAVLRNKVNPNNTTHHVTLAEADSIGRIMGDAGILRGKRSLCARRGGRSDGVLTARLGRRFTRPYPCFKNRHTPSANASGWSS